MHGMVRVGLRGAGEAHVACSSRDHAAETNRDDRHAVALKIERRGMRFLAA